MSPRRVEVRISGRVQGVGYRYSTQRQATALGLTGWVRNLPDGAVEAVFQGPSEIVDRMLEWCRRGPTTASVQSVQLSETSPLAAESEAFDVRY